MLSREEYRKAENCLKRYDYNSATIMFKRDDIFNLGAVSYDDLPKPKYKKSDVVSKAVIKLESDKEYQKAYKEYKAVELAKLLVNEDCLVILERLYRKKESKWKIIYEEGYSEETFKRRKKELIYQVAEEFKKV
jgi:hypothetical protein